MTPSEITLPLCPYCGPSCVIGYGLCHCGCGAQTNLIPWDDRRRGLLAGWPYKFTGRHARRYCPTFDYAEPFKIDGVYCRFIPLTQGQVAIIWEEDYAWLMQWKWHARWDAHTKSFYASRSAVIKGVKTTLSMHRDVLGLGYGEPLKGDHKNNCTLDNRRDNLRPANNYENTWNQRLRANNISGYKGIIYNNRIKKWTASIRIEGIQHHLGVFNTKEEAYAAYCKAAIIHRGEFARLA